MALQFNTENGLGDKLLDMIGFVVVCDELRRKPEIVWCKVSKSFEWGSDKYDERLFRFGFNISFIEEVNSDELVSPHRGVGLNVSKKQKQRKKMNYELFINELLTIKVKQLDSINNSCPNRYVHGFFRPVPF